MAKHDEQLAESRPPGETKGAGRTEVRFPKPTDSGSLRAADSAKVRTTGLRPARNPPPLMFVATVRMSGDEPIGFTLKRKQIVIEQIVSRWSESGRWWDGEVPCRFYEVLTSLGLFLLCLNEQDNIWYAKPVH